MIRNSSRFAPALLAAAANLCFAFSAGTLHATIVGAKSFGNEMAGGEITVFFDSQTSDTATIQDGGGTLGFATVNGRFDFRVDGDTFVENWFLTNLTSSESITLVLFDMTNTSSPGSVNDPGPHSPGILFDDNSSPSTMNSYAGRAGAVQVNADPPTIVLSTEVVAWANAMNMGDEFVQEEISFRDFGPGLTAIWRDDTDIVGIDTGPETPEPTTALLMLLGACALSGRRRRR